MRFRGLSILLIILAVLVVVTWMYRRRAEPPEPIRLFSDFGDVQKIVLSRGDSTIVLESAGDEWRIVSPIEAAAEEGAVSTLMDALRGMEIGEVVTRRPEMHESFGVGEGEKTEIFVQSSSGEVSFVAGKAAGFGEGYLRLSGEDAVYLVKGFSRHSFARGLDHWRDKSILSIPRDAVEGIDYSYATERFSLSKEDGEWRLNGADIDSSKILPVLAALENFRADGFLYEGECKPEVTLEVRLTGDRRESIRIGEMKDMHYPVMHEGDEAIFLVSSRIVDRLKKKVSDFR